MAGTSQLAAPITSAGVVLSQPVRRTTPSSGLARIDSSTSIDARLRNSIAVGRRLVSPSDITGNSRGRPPASYTPRFTCSAILRKCALQGVSSENVLQMPITGRPSNRSWGMPWFFIQLRWMNPSRSAWPNQAEDRSLRVLLFIGLLPYAKLLSQTNRSPWSFARIDKSTGARQRPAVGGDFSEHEP